MTDVELLDCWVKPFYLEILHANYVFLSPGSLDQQQFIANAQRALGDFTPAIGLRLIHGGWREAIAGSWFAGVSRCIECQRAIGEALLESKYGYANQSHAFALACFANEASIDCLCGFLDKYLLAADYRADMDWVLAALLWIDERNGSRYSSAFHAPWRQLTADKDDRFFSIEEVKSRFGLVMAFCDLHFPPVTK